MSYSKQQSLFRDYTKANLKMRMDEIWREEKRKEGRKHREEQRGLATNLMLKLLNCWALTKKVLYKLRNIGKKVYQKMTQRPSLRKTHQNKESIGTQTIRPE